MTKLIIKLFGYDQAQVVLTRTDKHGQHWYKAEAICSLLGIVGYSQAVHSHLVSMEWMKKTEFTGSSRRQLLFINNSGVYKLIQVARAEQANAVKERARNVVAPLRPATWPDEQLAA